MASTTLRPSCAASEMRVTLSDFTLESLILHVHLGFAARIAITFWANSASPDANRMTTFASASPFVRHYLAIMHVPAIGPGEHPGKSGRSLKRPRSGKKPPGRNLSPAVGFPREAGGFCSVSTIADGMEAAAVGGMGARTGGRAINTIAALLFLYLTAIPRTAAAFPAPRAGSSPVWNCVARHVVAPSPPPRNFLRRIIGLGGNNILTARGVVVEWTK